MAKTSARKKSKKVAKKVTSRRKVIKRTHRKGAGPAVFGTLLRGVSIRRPKLVPHFWNNYLSLGMVGVVLVAAGAYFSRAPHGTETARTKTTSTTMAKAGALEQEFAKASKMELNERVAFWSGLLDKKASVVSSVAQMGKGHTIDDNAPLIPSRYDCTTFVETVAALSRSTRAAEFYPNLIAIRYKNSQTNYAHRNHFPEVDWIPNNEKAGIISDVTASLASKAGVSAGTEKKEINRATWLAKQMEQGKVTRSLASVAEKTWGATADAKVSYINVKDIDTALAKVPTGTIVNFVHRSDDRHPVLISHQGFIVKDGGDVMLRHASSKAGITTVGFKSYLKGLLKDQGTKKAWALIGVNLNQLEN